MRIPGSLVLRVRSAAPLDASLVDAERGAYLGDVYESTTGLAAAAARLLARTPLRQALPFEVRVGPFALLRRGVAALRPAVDVLDPAGAPLGTLRQRLWATGGAFDVLDPAGRRIAALRLEDGRAELRGAEGGALASIAPASGPERRIDVEPGAAEGVRALLVAALAGIDRVLSG